MASTKSVNRREEFAASAEDVNGREGFSNTSLALKIEVRLFILSGLRFICGFVATGRFNIKVQHTAAIWLGGLEVARCFGSLDAA